MNCPRCGARLASDNRRPGALCSPCDRAEKDGAHAAKEAAAREKTMRAAFEVAVTFSQPERHRTKAAYLKDLSAKLDALCASMAIDLPRLESRWPDGPARLFVGPLGVGVVWDDEEPEVCRICEDRPQKHQNGLCGTCNGREWRRMKRGAPSQLIEVAS